MERIAYMNVLFVSDGSDDGCQTVETLAGMLDRQAVSKIKIVIVTFPERESPLWDKAYHLWLAEDDLHQAMGIVAQQQLDRLKTVFEPHAELIESAITVGDPVQEVLESEKSLGADLVLLAITSNDHRGEVYRISSEIVSKSPTPVVVAYGRPEPHSADRPKKAVNRDRRPITNAR